AGARAGTRGPRDAQSGHQSIEACARDPPTMGTSRRGTHMDDAARAGSAVGDGPPPLVIGGDIGGSSSRLVLAPLDGAVGAGAEGAGADLRASGAGARGPVASPARGVRGRGR